MALIDEKHFERKRQKVMQFVERKERKNLKCAYMEIENK